MTDEPRWNDLAMQAGRVFSPSAPIDELSLFAGRDTQIRTVVDAINQKGQHAIIYGERGVGKTSLSNVLHAFLGQQAFPVKAPRVQCEAQDTFDKVWRRVFEKIELTREKKGIIRLQNEAESETYRASELLEHGEVAPDDVRRILSTIAKKSLSIVIIDEFDRLTKERRRPFADTVKTLSDHAVPATVLLVGVADSVDELIHEHQSIERALVQVSMPRMSNDEIRQIVKTGLDKLGMAIKPEAMQHIVVLSQGLPHYTHLIGLYSARAALDAKTLEVDEGIVAKAIGKAVDNAQQSISSAWLLATRSQRKDNIFSNLLLSCALAETDSQNTFAAQDVRVPMREITGKPYAITSFSENLNDFCDEKRGPILQRTGSARKYRYRFINPLMQPFVIMQGFKGKKITKALLTKLDKRDE